MELSPEKNEAIKLDKLEIGGAEMLELVKQKPQEFLMEYAINPARKLIGQQRTNYDSIIGKRAQRSETAYEEFYQKWQETIGWDPSANPQKLAWLGKFRTNFNQLVSPGFCQFIRNQGLRLDEGETRLYLSISQEYLLNLTESLAEHQVKMPNLMAFKINLSDIERNENAVLYFSDQATKMEIDEVLTLLTDLESQLQARDGIFDGFDFVTPFSRSIIDPRTEMTIGQVARNPFPSSQGRVKLRDKNDGYEIGEAHTVNQLFARIVEMIKYGNFNADDEIAAAELLSRAEVVCQFAKNGPKETMDLIDYCRLCLDQLSKILEDK